MAIIIAQRISHILKDYQADVLYHPKLNLLEKSVTSDISDISVVKKSHVSFTKFLQPLVPNLLSESRSNGPLFLQFYTINT